MKSARGRPAAAHRLEQRLVIAAPRDEVWSLVEDPDALMQWVHGLQSVTSASGMSGGFALGATFVQRIRIGLIPDRVSGRGHRVRPAESGGGGRPSLAVRPRHQLRLRGGGRRTEVTCRAAVHGRALGTVIPAAQGGGGHRGHPHRTPRRPAHAGRARVTSLPLIIPVSRSMRACPSPSSARSSSRWPRSGSASSSSGEWSSSGTGVTGKPVATSTQAGVRERSVSDVAVLLNHIRHRDWTTSPCALPASSPSP